jgi:hypothetical protein
MFIPTPETLTGKIILYSLYLLYVIYVFIIIYNKSKK